MGGLAGVADRQAEFGRHVVVGQPDFQSERQRRIGMLRDQPQQGGVSSRPSADSTSRQRRASTSLPPMASSTGWILKDFNTAGSSVVST